MARKKRLFPALRLIVFAIAAGAVGGAIAVYVNGGPDGNTGATPVASTQDTVCPAKLDRAKAVGAAATGEVAAMLAADPPRSLQALSFKGPDGEGLTIGDFAGKVVLMNLWATWCTPCREEMPELDALQKSKGGDGFEVVAVNVDRGDDAKPKAFLADTKIEALRYYRDSSMKVFNDLKSQGLALGLPVTVLIDEEGCLLAHMNGPANWGGADAARFVEAASPGGP